MPEHIRDTRELASIRSFKLYVEPDGKLFVNTGRVKLRVTEQEARELLDYLLMFARYVDGSQALVGVNGHER